MKRMKALLDFIQLTVPAKIAFYRNGIVKLTGNARFANPDVSLDDAKLAVDKLENAYLDAKDGGHTKVSAMHDAEDAADELFRLLAAYVNRIAAGDETTILSSGFNTSKQTIKSTKPELAVDKGDVSGNVWVVAKAIEKAGAYIWQYAKDAIPQNESEWTTAGHSTQSYIQISGLTVASKYYFRMAAIVPEGKTDFTAPVLKVVE